MTTRHRISTREIDLRDYLQIGPDDRGLERVPMFDEWQMATTGISADLEQQRRQRAWRERITPSRDDLGWFLIGIGIVVGMAGILVGLIWVSDLLLRTFAAP